MNHPDACRFQSFGNTALHLMVLILPMTLAAQNLGPQEIYGAAVDENGSPMAGVKVMLKSRSDSAITAADGLYRLRMPVRNVSVFPGGAKAPGVRTGKASIGGKPVMGVRIGDFNALGRKQPLSMLSPGRTSAPAAKNSAHSQALDTMVAEKTGHYSVMEVISEYPLAALPMMPIRMFPNSIYGMDPAEIAAWKEFLSMPTVTLRLTRSLIELPRENTGGMIIKADGEAVSAWSSDVCNPGELPKAVHVLYVREGREYRDTVPLAPFWSLLDSFRAMADSAAPNRMRYAMTWDWPGEVSVRPERDWMSVKLGDMSVDEFISYPDVDQLGVRMDIEGGVTRYGQFQPATESLTVVTWVRPMPRIKAVFTWKSHAGHDLRILVDDHQMRHCQSYRNTDEATGGHQ